MTLKRQGFTVVAVETGEEGLEKALELQPLVITLDLMLPGINGLEVCQQLRANAATEDLYVLMVTALGDQDDKITGFQVGADDYLVKPFQPEELVLRVSAAARRMKRILSTVEPTDVFSIQGLRLDANQHRVWIDDDEIKMTITEYKLLTHLLRKQDQLCSRGELLQEVWELPPNLNTRTVDTHIKRLRQKMQHLAPFIQTVRGAGYRFSQSEVS
jgi:two-component system phosphate regulon response regulator PhoB